MNMLPVTFAGGRRALTFGQQKLNLHPADAPISPHASRPTPGSADLCFISTTPIAEVAAHLQRLGVAIEEGPVRRTGATGSIMSIYFRDPDDNLIEVAEYERRQRRRFGMRGEDFELRQLTIGAGMRIHVRVKNANLVCSS